MKRFNVVVKYLVIFAVALSMSSCASALKKKLSIEGYDNLQVMGFSGVKVDLELRNESLHKINIEDVTAVLKQDGKEVATVELKEGFVLPRRTESVMVPTVWRLCDVNPLAAFSASKKILKGETDAFKVDLDATGRVAFIRKKYRRENMSLRDLIKRVVPGK